MFKELFSNRLFIGALVLFIFCVVGSLLYMQHVKRQDTANLAETQQRVKQWDEKQNPTTAEVNEGDTSPGGHFHADGTSHEGPHVDALMPPKTLAQLPIASSGERVLTKGQKAEIRKFWADLRLEPPPKGYGYRWDENGKASLFEYNVPRYETKWTTEEVPGQDYYKLTNEEWARHRVLQHIISQNPLRLTPEQTKMVTLEGKPFPTVDYATGVVELAKEWLSELERKASGPVPNVSSAVTWTRQPTQRELQEIARKEVELLNALEKPGRPSPGPWDEDLIAEVVKELEAEIQRR